MSFASRAKGPVRNRLSPSPVLLYHRNLSPSISVSSLVILRSRWMGICLRRKLLFEVLQFWPHPKVPIGLYLSFYYTTAEPLFNNILAFLTQSRCPIIDLPDRANDKIRCCTYTVMLLQLHNDENYNLLQFGV